MSLSDISVAFIALLLSSLAFVSATRAARATQRAEASKVDAEAYERASRIYDQALEQLRRQNVDQEEQIRRLTQQVALLERTLHGAGMPVPVLATNGASVDEPPDPPAAGTSRT